MKRGFTIVELLIVVVVIAILAAITIVAYNGIQNSARDSALQSSVSQAAKKIAAHSTLHSDELPATLGVAGVSDTPSVQYTYVPVDGSSRKGYCVSATSPDNAAATFAVTSDSGRVIGGACITNRVPNPGAETVTTGWGLSVNSSSASRTPAAALVGSYGIQVTTSSTSDSGVSIPISGTLAAGTTYTASFKIKAVTAANYSLSMQGTAGSSGRRTQVLSAGEEAVLKYTWTPATSGSAMFYALRQGGQSGAATFYVDGAVLVEGAIAYTYGVNGDAGWLWTGTVNNSVSIGPAIVE